MRIIKLAFLAKCWSIAMAACTGMSSPQNINSNTGSFTSPGWRNPLPASDVCEWVMNVPGVSNVVVKLNLLVDTESTPDCGDGRLEMPDGTRECRKPGDQCFIYSYGEITNDACRRDIEKTPCKFVELTISQWPPRFRYVQDADGLSQGFSLNYSSSACDSMVFPTPKSTIEVTTTSTETTTSTRAPTRPPRRTSDSKRPTISQGGAASTTVASQEGASGLSMPVIIVLLGILVLALLIVIIVLLIRHFKRRKSTDSKARLTSNKAENVGAYGSNGAQVGMYAAAADCESGYDDSQLRTRPTPAERPLPTAGVRAGTENAGYDDLRLKPNSEDGGKESPFYREVRKKSDASPLIGHHTDSHTYEEVRRLSSAVPDNAHASSPHVGEYNYDN